MLHSRTNPKKIIEKFKKQTQYYYEEAMKSDKVAIDNKNLYKHSVHLLVNNIKDKKELEKKKTLVKQVVIEKPIEVIKKVPYPVVKEVIKKVEVPVEVEVIKEIPKEIVKEIIKRVPYEVEVIKEVRNYDFENKLKENIEQLKVDNANEIDTLNAIHQAELLSFNREKVKEIDKLKDEHEVQLKSKDMATKALEDRYKAAVVEAIYKRKEQEITFNLFEKKRSKKIKWMSTGLYFLSLYSSIQTLWMLI